MDAQAIVERAQSLGVTLSVADGRIRYAPKSRAPADFVETLREHKPEVIVYLCHQSVKELASPETSHLLAWASELAERDVVLLNPVNYVEAPLRKVTTQRVSFYASYYLKTIIAARLYQEHSALCWGQWTPKWWQERESEAIGALASLKAALEEQVGYGH